MAIYYIIREISVILTAFIAFLPTQNIQEIRQIGVNKDLDFLRQVWSHKGNQFNTFV